MLIGNLRLLNLPQKQILIFQVQVHQYSVSKYQLIIAPQITTEVSYYSRDICFELELMTTFAHTALIVKYKVANLIYLINVLLLNVKIVFITLKKFTWIHAILDAQSPLLLNITLFEVFRVKEMKNSVFI